MFAIRNLSVLSYANGFTLWHYKTGVDTLAQVKGQGYFADAGNMKVGDMILAVAKDGAGLLHAEADNSASPVTE